MVLDLQSVREECLMLMEVLLESLGIVSCHGGNNALSRRQRRPPRCDAGKILEDRLRYRRAEDVEIAEDRREHGIDHAEGGAVEIGSCG